MWGSTLLVHVGSVFVHSALTKVVLDQERKVVAWTYATLAPRKGNHSPGQGVEEAGGPGRRLCSSLSQEEQPVQRNGSCAWESERVSENATTGPLSQPGDEPVPGCPRNRLAPGRHQKPLATPAHPEASSMVCGAPVLLKRMSLSSNEPGSSVKKTVRAGCE